MPDPTAIDPAAERIYQELRSLARSVMRGARSGHTLQPTALVHEAYLKLAPQDDYHFGSRAAFFALAARAMRQVLMDHAKARSARKRGQDPWRVTYMTGLFVNRADPVDALALHEALEHLERLDPQAVRVVELRFFAGLSVEEVAAALGISTATVKRDTTTARAWLLRQLHSSDSTAAPHG